VTGTVGPLPAVSTGGGGEVPRAAAGPPSSIDLNADLGEGFGAWKIGDDDALLGVVSSANVACGFHAGDPSIMRRVCDRAVASGVAIGAHVSYRDLEGFGRRRLDVTPAELRDQILYQVGALAAIAAAAGGRVAYVKAHGALYNVAADDPVVARAVAAAVRDCGADLAMLCLPGSAQARAAGSAGVPAVAEGYLDRAYDLRGRLVPRGQPGAVIHDAEQVTARALGLAMTGSVLSSDGQVVEVAPRSLCVHGDTPGALDLARRVRHALEEAGITVAPFARSTAAAGGGTAPVGR
jgi:5-oxoprolinase (ATP-hydrolysing) subunit A